MADLPLHCVVVWDIYTSEATVKAKVQAELRAALKGASWVRPMAGTPFFIVKVTDALERERLKESLVGVAKANPRSVRLVIGPVVQGSYGGWLPRDTWPKVRKRTAPAGDEG